MTGMPNHWLNLELRHDYWPKASPSRWVQVHPSQESAIFGVRIREVGDLLAVLSQSTLPSGFTLGLILQPTDPRFFAYTDPADPIRPAFAGLSGDRKPRFHEPDEPGPRPEYFLDVPLSLCPPSAPPTFLIAFKCRSTYWRYIISGLKADETSSLAVTANGAQVQFKKLEEPILGPDGNPALTFLSETAMPMTQAPPFKVRLSDAGRLNGQVLPTPEPHITRLKLTAAVKACLKRPIQKPPPGAVGGQAAKPNWVYCSDIFVNL